MAWSEMATNIVNINNINIDPRETGIENYASDQISAISFVLPHSGPTWNPTCLDLVSLDLQVGPRSGWFMYLDMISPCASYYKPLCLLLYALAPPGATFGNLILT